MVLPTGNLSPPSSRGSGPRKSGAWLRHCGSLLLLCKTDFCLVPLDISCYRDAVRSSRHPILLLRTSWLIIQRHFLSCFLSLFLSFFFLLLFAVPGMELFTMSYIFTLLLFCILKHDLAKSSRLECWTYKSQAILVIALSLLSIILLCPYHSWTQSYPPHRVAAVFSVKSGLQRRAMIELFKMLSFLL